MYVSIEAVLRLHTTQTKYIHFPNSFHYHLLVTCVRV